MSTIEVANGRLRPRMKTLAACLCLLATPAAAAWLGTRFSYERDTPHTEIYRGVYYRSYREPFGRVHLVEVDLTQPGVELYMTPLDREAVAAGYQYRLDYVRNAARANGLAVAINGTFFSADTYLVPMVGDFARSVDSIIANYRLNHLHPLDYLLWFDERLTPYVETARPAPAEALRNAKWAVGGQTIVVRDRERWPRHEDPPNRQTRLGVDPERKRLWLAVVESATNREAAEVLMRAGARYVMVLDGGDSSCLYLGGRARGVAGGLQIGGQRAVATMIGIQADPILDPL